jgi:hypothetical protein
LFGFKTTVPSLDQQKSVREYKAGFEEAEHLFFLHVHKLINIVERGQRVKSRESSSISGGAAWWFLRLL